MQLGEPQRTTACKCLKCGYQLDGVAGAGHDNAPEPGDISICFKCGNIAAFDGELRVRELTAEEWKIINAQDEIMHMQSLIRGFNEEFGRI